MGLSAEQVAPTLNVLYNQGNMSSVTVLAVLQEIQTCLKPKNGDLGLMAAFGPGFVAETALFEWQRAKLKLVSRTPTLSGTTF
jgi:predicted naringenin-chalcone synthase